MNWSGHVYTVDEGGKELLSFPWSWQLAYKAVEQAKNAGAPLPDYFIYHPDSVMLLGGDEGIALACREFGLESMMSKFVPVGKVLFFNRTVTSLYLAKACQMDKPLAVNDKVKAPGETEQYVIVEIVRLGHDFVPFAHCKRPDGTVAVYPVHELQRAE